VKLGLKDRGQVLRCDLGNVMGANATLALDKRVKPPVCQRRPYLCAYACCDACSSPNLQRFARPEGH
jgi:hypothetical protein